MVECELPKLKMRVRFPLLAPTKTAPFGVLFLWRIKSNGIEPIRSAKDKNNVCCFYLCKLFVTSY